MSRPVTIKDIGKRLGIHFGTISRALRNDPRVLAETCERIQAVAQEMGYVPNAQARALSLHRQMARPATARGALALLLAHPGSSATQAYENGTRQRAGELGYALDVIYHHAPGLGDARLNRILKNRGIAGVVIVPLPTDSRILKRLRLEWSQFPAVFLGNSIFRPELHRVADDQFRDLRLLTRKLSGLGYRRIGFCAPKKVSFQAENSWLGGYLAEMMRLNEPPRIFFQKSGAFEDDAIRQWVHRENLDSVITDHPYALDRLRRLVDKKVPAELGIVTLHGANESISGINQFPERIAAASVDYLVHLIHSHQRGIPEAPQRILLEGVWFEGKTTRRLN